MSGYSKDRLPVSCVTEPAVHKWKKASGINRGKRHGRKKIDGQHGPQATMCDLPNLKISGVCSLSQNSYHYNTYDASWFIDGQHDPAHEKPADANDYKMLSELDMECICLDTDAASISSNESDHIIREEGTWIAQNVSTSMCKGKNPNKLLPSDSTEEGCLYKTPKLPVCPTVSSLMTESENARPCNETSVKVDFIKHTQHADGVQVHVGAVLPASEKALDVKQKTFRKLRSLMHTAENPFIQLKQNKLKRNKTSSIVYPNNTEIEKHTLSEVQRKSSFPNRFMTVLSDNQPMHDPKNNTGNNLPSKEFCCTHSGSAFIYNKQLQGSYSFSVGSTKPRLNNMAGSYPVSQVILDQKCGKYDVSLVNDPNTSTNTVQKGSTLTQDKLRPSHMKKHKSEKPTKVHILNKQKRKTREGRRKCNEKNIHSEGKQESNVNTVLELKTLRKKSRQHSQKKAQPSDIRLKEGKEEAKSKSMDCDIICITLNESDSDIIEVEASIPENVRKDLDKEHVSQQVTLSSPMSKLENRKVDGDPNVFKADLNRTVQDIDHVKLNSTTVAIQPVSTTKVLAVVEHHRTLPENKFGLKRYNLLDESAEARYINGKLLSKTCNTFCSEVPIEHPLSSDIKEIQEQTSASLDITTEPYNQGDQEYPLIWTDQLSKLMTHFPFGITNLPTQSISEVKKNATLHPKDYSKEVSDDLDGVRDLIKQFDEEHKSLPHVNRSSDMLYDVKPLDDQSSDETKEKRLNDTSPKDFCCILDWSAFTCGQQSKCSCTSKLHKPTGDTTQYTPSGKPQSTYETITTFASPKLDVIKSDIGTKGGKVKKPCSNDDDNSQPHPTKEEQSLTQLNKKLYIKKDNKETITSTTRDLGLDVCSKTGSSKCLKDGGFSFESDIVTSAGLDVKVLGQMPKEVDPTHLKNNPLPSYITRSKKWKRRRAEQDFKVPGQMPKEVDPTDPKNKPLPSYMTRSKKCKRRHAEQDFKVPGQMPKEVDPTDPKNKPLPSYMTRSKKWKRRRAEQDFKVPGQMPKEVDPTDPKNKPLPSYRTRSKKWKRRCAEQDFPGQISKEVNPVLPKNEPLPNDMTRPKKRKRLVVPRARSTVLCPEKFNSYPELEILEQTIASQIVSDKFSSPATNKSESKMGLQDSQNFQDQTKEVVGIKRSNLNTKRSFSKSCLTTDTKVPINQNQPELETNTVFQLRMLEVEQQPTKYNNSLVNTVTENTSTMANQSTEDFSVLPAVKKLTEDTHQKKQRRGKQRKRPCIPTEGKKTRSTSRRESHVLHQKEREQHVPSDKIKATANPILKSSQIQKMAIKQYKKSTDGSRKYVEEETPATSDVEVKTADASHGGVTHISTLKEKMCMKRCKLQLYRIAVPIQGNMRETDEDSKVEGKVEADTKNKEE